MGEGRSTTAQAEQYCDAYAGKNMLPVPRRSSERLQVKAGFYAATRERLKATLQVVSEIYRVLACSVMAW